ncbi:MAG: pectate lyase [Candidatus Woesebacteria bacterium]
MSTQISFGSLVRESVNDLLGKSHPIQNNDVHIQEGLKWLCHAQDKSGDNGVSAWYSLISGWQPSYIETTGYIINTFLDTDRLYKKMKLKDRAVRMADFLIKMQHPLGGYRTAVPSKAVESVPTVFNTGQDLLGMAAVFSATKKEKYRASAILAADFLLSIQEKDGSWLQYTYGSMKHTYHTRVAWGILEVWKITGKKKYLTAARKNIDWAAKQQQPNGWFKQNQLPHPNPSIPYTHTIAYAIEGFLWSGLLLQDDHYMQIAIKGALPLADLYLKNEFLPGTFDSNWKSENSYTCLTGDAQLALVWLELFKYGHDFVFLKAAVKMIEYLKSVQPTEKDYDQNLRGSLKGSYPIYGDLHKNTGYCRFAYLNWATKFFIDALVVEEQIALSLT